MTRFRQEWALVPAGARWAAALAALAVAVLTAAMFLLPLLAGGEHKALLFVFPVFFAAIYVLLLGYVFGDARRRGMHYVLWTILAVFIPSGVGIILYFILRDPVPVPCPACATPSRKGHAFCTACGAPVRVACPDCKQPIEPSWRNCARCGASLAAPLSPAAERDDRGSPT